MADSSPPDPTSSSEQDERSTPPRTGVNLDAQGDVNIGGDVVGRDKITQTIRTNIIQIGTLTLPTAPLVALLAFLVVGAAAVVWGLRGPTQMTAPFRVAVAEFGEIADGQVRSSEAGRTYSQWVFDALRAQTASYDDPNVGSAVGLWHDSLPFTQKGTTLGIVTDEKTAAQLADRIGADMVIYGHLDRQAALTLEFYVSPRLRQQMDAVVGRYQIGDEPIDVSGTTSLGSNQKLVTRTNLLFWLTIGLSYDLSGFPAQARQVYQEAEAQALEAPGRIGGEEILYFLIGQAELFQGKDVEAQAAFEESLQRNPQYARARIGLGSVYFVRAQRVQPPRLRLQSGNPGSTDLERALTEYTLARDVARQSSDGEIELLATLALGIAHRLEGEAYLDAGQAGEADRAFTQAVDYTRQALLPLAEARQYRLLAQAHLALGTAQAQQAHIQVKEGNRAAAIALFEAARSAYALCIQLGDQAPDDPILNQMIIAESCQPYDQAAEEALRTLK